MARGKQLLFLEFNEINFQFIEGYIARGELSAFRAFFDRHGYSETTSEQQYEELEPWIQWVTAHTGKPLAEHGVFRLGDIVKHDIPQIWETLEDKGLRVGAISPMNAKYRLKEPAFFVPDPWTATQVVAPPVFERMYHALAQAVNDNAEGRLTAKSAFDLAFGGLRAASPANYPLYTKLLVGAARKPWMRAMFLDLMLADLFNLCVRQTRPDFATLFLNAGAHIQHHYMFSSPVYEGPMKNPDWYIAAGEDPLLDVYRLYDHVLAQTMRRFPDARLMIATGLHQDPHPEVTYYWRLKDHAAFLTAIGVPFAKVEPRMSRDFLITCADAAEAERAAARLALAAGEDGAPLFEIDNRGDELFVMLTYPNDIARDAGFRVGNERFEGLRDRVAFVAIKNGCHNGIGYFADSGVAKPAARTQFPLAALPGLVDSALAA